MDNAQDNRADGTKKEMENSHQRRRIKTMQIINWSALLSSREKQL